MRIEPFQLLAAMTAQGWCFSRHVIPHRSEAQVDLFDLLQQRPKTIMSHWAQLGECSERTRIASRFCQAWSSIVFALHGHDDL